MSGKLRRILFCLMLISIVCGLMGGYSAAAAGRATLNSATDFYEQFAQQIQDREALRYFDVPDKNLAKELVYQNLDGFAAHYDQSKPLLSGCYLIYYIQKVYFTYDANGLKVLIEFPYNGGEMNEHFKKMATLAGQLKKETDYETVQNVHDYLIDHFEYDHNTEMANHTDIDGFRDKKMVCSGYSLATYYLLNSVGIETRIITGYGGEKDEKDTNHMWNMVKLDGKWYNLDVTWDDGGGSRKDYTYFLKSDADFPMHVRTGAYATAEFQNMVSRESYPLPFRLRIKSMNMSRIFYAAIIVGALVFMFLRYIWRTKNSSEAETVEMWQDQNWQENRYGPSQQGQWQGPNPVRNPYGGSTDGNPYGVKPEQNADDGHNVYDMDFRQSPYYVESGSDEREDEPPR
ncbi:MAG: hypothetical protein IKQ49_00795 [Eubacterium sp.]|nr:hypothetical protein [Eubacterium sp.]